MISEGSQTFKIELAEHACIYQANMDLKSSFLKN